MNDKYELHIYTRDAQSRRDLLTTTINYCRDNQLPGVYYTDSYGDINLHVNVDGGTVLTEHTEDTPPPAPTQIHRTDA